MSETPKENLLFFVFVLLLFADSGRWFRMEVLRPKAKGTKNPVKKASPPPVLLRPRIFQERPESFLERSKSFFKPPGCRSGGLSLIPPRPCTLQLQDCRESVSGQ